jgi:hypothetical protein
MRDSIRKLGLLFVLLDNLFIPGDFGFDFRVQYILYLLFIIYFFFFYRTVKLNTKRLVFFGIFFFILGLVPIFKGSGISEFARQAILIWFNLLFSYLLLNSYNHDMKRVFEDYIQLIFFASIVGIIQIISQAIGFKFGADFSYLGFEMQNFAMHNLKIQSWFQEPSFLAIAFIPVAFICVARLFDLTDWISKKKAIFIIIVLILSQSSIGLIGLMISLGFVVFSKYSILRSPISFIALLIVSLITALTFYQIPQVKLRVDDSAHLFLNRNVTREDVEKTNISTYALYSNYRVATSTFKDNPVFGTGLGTHEINYRRYIEDVIPESNIRKEFPLNSSDANSLLLRIVSELGTVGLILLFVFLFKNSVNFRLRDLNTDQITFWLINKSILVLFLIRLLRQGHYTMLGFMLFVLIYYYSRLHYFNLESNKGIKSSKNEF